MVARPATSLEVAGSSPVVGVDRCGLRPNRFDGRTLSFELFENQKENVGVLCLLNFLTIQKKCSFYIVNIDNDTNGEHMT